jgi:hypothetical protein
MSLLLCSFLDLAWNKYSLTEYDLLAATLGYDVQQSLRKDRLCTASKFIKETFFQKPLNLEGGNCCFWNPSSCNLVEICPELEAIFSSEMLVTL